MHPTQILTVKQEILRTDISKLKAWAQEVIHSDEPLQSMQSLATR